ncbi:adenylyltransferase/cytidyltransferase family protein, partial [bacterium]|nr:adenylyltransferase/cytidyltransferase family protein [bacterium]
MFALFTWIAGGVMMVAGIALVLRERRRRVTGLALGVYDFCHEGHVNLLRRAAERCDRLVVGVHTDAAVREYKGVQPANSELERAAAIRELGVAEEVVVGSDRAALCRRYRVSRVFHGDDWDSDTYRRRWGEELLAELDIELVMLPHTAGIDSTRLRARVPRIGWWLYSSVPDWSRAHIFSHLRDLYAELGGIWFVAGPGRELVRGELPGAPCVLLEPGQESSAAARAISHHDLDVIVTAHFNYEAMTDVLRDLGHDLDLVVLSHGRSGKPGTSADVAGRREGMRVVDASGATMGASLFRCGAVTV